MGAVADWGTGLGVIVVTVQDISPQVSSDEEYSIHTFSLTISMPTSPVQVHVCLAVDR